MLRKVTIAAITLVLALVICAGCETYSESKKLAKMRWEKASVGVKLTLAQQEYERNQLDQAKRDVTKCLIADPNNAQAYLLYGKLLLAEGDRADAVRELRLAVKLDEELGEGWYWLGLATYGPEQTQQSWWESQQVLFYYNKALALNPSNIEYILAVAETYVEQEKPEEAIKLLEEKIGAFPEQVLLKTAAGDLMWRLGKNERAIELYKQALLIRDDSSIAETLGYYYVFSSRWSEGADIFNKLVKQCQDEQKKKLYLQTAALCSMNCAQYDRAVNCYNELSINERNNADIWVKMGQAALGAGSAERALMCGKRALDIKPGDVNATTLLGCAQYSIGDYTAAIKSFEKIIPGNKNEGISWLMRARCYEKLGRKYEAEQAYKKALEIEPNSELGDFLGPRFAGTLNKGKNAEDLRLSAGN
jgi:tetratricopeptide (TPR) repeat protein